MEKIRRGRRGAKKQMIRRILAACLCAAILAANVPVTAFARVEAIELEELAIPTDYPVRGVMHIQLAAGKKTTGAKDTYIYEENYLPVLVDADYYVYAHLDTLSDLLGISLSYSGGYVTVTSFHTKIHLALNDRVAGYENDFFQAYVNMGHAPVSYEDVWYVPMDPFLKLVDADVKYGGENWLGKEECYLIPPQRTALDDIQDFYRYVYVDYSFEYIRDTGMTVEQMKRMMGWSEIGLTTKGFGSLDTDAWRVALLSWWGDNINAIEYSQIDTFMAHMLSAEDNIASKMTEVASKYLDGAGVAMDIAESIGGIDKVKNVFKSVAGKDSAAKLTKWKQYFKAAQTIDMGAKHLLSMAAVCDNLMRVDEKELEAARYFYENSEGKAVMIDHFRKRMKKNIEDRENALARAGNNWLLQDFLKLAVDMGGLANISSVSAVGVFSSFWDAGTGIVNMVTGNQLDKMEAFIQGVFGMQYEMDAIKVARDEIDDMLISGSRSITDADKEKLRRIVAHALKACYVTRTAGCQARGAELEKSPGVKAMQERINDTIADMIARLTMDDDIVAFGKTKRDLMNVHIQEYDHFPNVIFNLCQISGQVLSWDDEKPLKGVKIEVVGDDGSTIHEFKTDADGEFDESFELDDVNPYTDTPIQKVLTLHLTYRRNPVVLEYIQIQCFHSYLITGLHAGKKTEEVIAYVNGARDEGGRTVLDISRIELADDTLCFDVPDWQDGTFGAYAAMPDQISVASDMESVVLDDDVAVRTIYSQVAPEGSLLNGLMRFVGEAYEDDTIEDIFRADMHTAEEIQKFIDVYTEVNGEIPAFRIKKVNSLVDSMEQVVVVTAD